MTIGPTSNVRSTAQTGNLPAVAPASAPAATPTVPAVGAPVPVVGKDQSNVNGTLPDAAQFAADPYGLSTARDDEQKQAAIARIMEASSQATRDFINHVAKPNFAPETMAAVYQLAAEGKLDAINPDGSNLRDEVSQLMAKSDRSGINVAQAVLQQISNPDDNVLQAKDNTCAAATAQKTLAETNPAAYFKLATDIITKGSTTLPNGDTVSLSSPNRTWIDAQGFTDSQKMDAMVQAALMDYADGSKARFDIASDRSTTLDGQEVYQGLGIGQAARLDDGLLSAPTLDPRSYQGASSLRDQLQAAKDRGAPGLFVPIDAGNGKAHMILVQGVDADGTAHYFDANGKPQAAPVSALAAELANGVTDDDGGIGTSSARGPQGGGGRRR